MEAFDTAQCEVIKMCMGLGIQKLCKTLSLITVFECFVRCPKVYWNAGKSQLGVTLELYYFCKPYFVQSLYPVLPKKKKRKNLAAKPQYKSAREHCEVPAVYRRRPRRPPFLLVESVGQGVTSSIRPIRMPALARARRAACAPGPGAFVPTPPVALILM